MEKKKEKELVYIVFIIPIKKEWPQARAKDHLYSLMEILKLSDEEKEIYDANNVYIKQMVLPSYGEKTEVIKVYPNELSDDTKQIMENNVMLIQGYLKKIKL